MIRYSLRCDADHQFDSWFANAAAYDMLAKSGQVSCAICGSTKVEKSLMVPSVRPGRKQANPQPASDQTAPVDAGASTAAPQSAPPPSRPVLSAPGSALEAAFAALRQQIEANSEYVGNKFVGEARKIHNGEVPERAIYGEAKPEEARALMDEGIALMPLPFMPSRKTN